MCWTGSAGSCARVEVKMIKNGFESPLVCAVSRL